MKNISALSITVNPGLDENLLSIFDELYNIDKFINLNLFTTSYNINKQNKRFSVLPIYEAKYYSGTLLVWNLLSLELTLDFPNLTKIVYYQNNDIPWSTNKSIPYVAWARLFENPKVSMIVDNPTVHEIFKLTWKEPTLITDITPETLYEVL